jgi:hypothetical protein
MVEYQSLVKRIGTGDKHAATRLFQKLCWQIEYFKNDDHNLNQCT